MQKTIRMRGTQGANKGILPPGIEKNSKIVFGIMWLRLGRLTLFDKAAEGKSQRVFVQFWGEKQPTTLQPENNVNAEHPRMHEYEIRCPVLNFQKYLLDMKNNLKVEVVDHGSVSIDFKSLLVKKQAMQACSANHTSKSAFDHFKSNFPVMKQGKKVGTLDIEMASNFNPKILEVEVEQQNLQCRNAVDMLAVQKPWVLEEFLEVYDKEQRPFGTQLTNEESIIEDRRLPNSLNIQQPEEEKFDPYNYREQEQRRDIPKQEKQAQHAPPAIEPLHRPQSVEEETKDFPALEKILTYSNLKLRDDQEEEPPRRDDLKPSLRLQESPKQRIAEEEEQIRRNQQLRREFYGHDTSQELEDIIASVPKSEEERPKVIPVAPTPAELPSVANSKFEEEQPKLIPVAPTTVKPLDFVPAAIVRPQMQPKPYPQQVAERVLLTLYAELHSVKLNHPVDFHLMYKNYGQAERTRIDRKPNNQLIAIVSVVGAHELKIMDRVPFIVEVWDTRKNAFIGLLKVDLSKIKQGFLLGGQHINEKAVRANILPTTVFKGPIDLQNLKKTQVGEAWMQVLIGTSAQISTYMNEPKDEPIPAKPSLPPKEQHRQPQNEAITAPTASINQLELFSEFIGYLRLNHTRLTSELLRIMSLQELSQEAFATFLNRINRISFLPLFNLLNYQSKGTFSVQLISDSFDEFSETWSQLQTKLQERKQLLSRILTEEVLAVVEANSQFNLISKEKFVRILTEYSKLSVEEVRALLRYHTEEFLSTTKLRNSMTTSAVLPEDNTLPPKLMEQEVLNQMKQLIRANDMQPSDVVGQFKSTDRVVSIQDLSRLFRTFKVNVSFWRMLTFIDRIKNLTGDQNRSPHELSYASFYNWFSSVKRDSDEEAQDHARIEALKKRMQPTAKASVVAPPHTSEPPPRTPAALQQNRSVASQGDQIPNLGSLVNEIMEQRHQLPHLDLEEEEMPKHTRTIPQSPHAQQQLAQTTKRWRHSFVIEPTELLLEKPMRGSCIISYRFPHEEEQVEARQFPLFPDKHRYELRMLGKHSVVLEDPLAAYIADEVLMFQVRVDGADFAEAAMPTEQYLIEQGTETKVLALFGYLNEEDAEPVLVGKLRIKLCYNREPSNDNFIGRETTTSLFLPRSGNLNVQVSCCVDGKRIASQLKLKEDFYCSLQFQLFPQSRELQHLAKMLHSKLHASLAEVVYLKDSLKLKLTPAIIEYLKSRNCRITLLAVYYQRMEGVPKKQVLQLGAIDIPLLAVVTGKGIQGEYAFKNKYGMFVALATCNINYGRSTKLEPEEGAPGLTDSQLQPKQANEKIWLLLNFLEVLQYGESMKNVAFEMYHHREKLTTARCPLNPREIATQLKGCTLLLQLTQQELFEQTFLTIGVKTASKDNKLSVQLNTRPLVDSLQRTKHTAYSGYFAVAEERKDILPMRIGLKVAIFRGSNKLKDFVLALQQHPQLDVFEELDLPAELDNYPKMMELFRHELKLPKAHFEEHMSELLTGRERLNIELFTTRIKFRLDLSQLRARTYEDLARLLEGCPQMEAPSQTVLEVIQGEELQIINFKPEFIGRFTFAELDPHRLDRNAELFDMGGYVDVLTFARKIEVLQRRSFSRRRENSGDVYNSQEQEEAEESDTGCQYLLRVAIEKGKNIESLYNGIKPNSLVRCALLELETEVAERESNPEYNLQTELQLDARQLADFKKLDFEIYHRLSIEGEGSEEILIGHGRIDISSLLFFKGDHKSSVFTVHLTPEKSYMKNVKAELRIVCQIERLSEDLNPMRRSRESIEPSAAQVSGYDINRIARILKEDVRAGRQMLFESSDEDS